MCRMGKYGAPAPENPASLHSKHTVHQPPKPLLPSVIYAAVLGLKVTCVPFSGGTVATAVENDLNLLVIATDETC